MRALILPLLLIACSAPADEPGQVTPDEQAELNDAAAALDANSVDLNAVTANAAEEPAQ